MRVYISGPITGTDDYQERFKKAEEYLRRQGYEVINPARVNGQMPELKWEEYMNMSMTMLSLCDMIFMLRGWKESQGAKLEHEYASNGSIHTIYEKEEMYEQTVKKD